jgi:hypothetical protein
MIARAVTFGLALAACAPSDSRPPPAHGEPLPAVVPSPRAVTADAAPPDARAQELDPDGNDELATPAIVLPERGKLVKVGRHWGALQRVCDFAVHGDSLLMAHATEPLGLGGASLTRYRPGDEAPFAMVFDWNRPGEPEKGGGAAGQGFLRIRAIDGRLWVPDADPPYLGFRVTPGMAEGYVFASDSSGSFERARRPGHRPPASAVVLPGALHVFDAIRFRGRLFASSSAVVPASGKNAGSPGTLFVQGSEPLRWEVAFTYPGASERGARLGYMVRFLDRLYVALSALDDSDPNDYIVIAPPRDATAIAPEHARVVRVTRGVHTLRWYAHRGRLYWIALGASGSELLVTEDGERWSSIALPAGVGSPADVLGVGDRLIVLAERALLELGPRGARVIARVEEKKTPFVVNDAYCAPPLAVLGGKLYAGSHDKGALYELAAAD